MAGRKSNVRNSSYLRLAPGVVVLALLLMAPVFGSESRPAGVARVQSLAAGRGSALTPPPIQSRSQNPPPQGQSSPRPTPNAEQFLGWEWWKDENVKKEMKLTDAQVRSISQTYDRRVREFTPFRTELEKQREALNRMTLERAVDEATYAVQVSQVQNLQSKLNETRAVMLYTFYRRLDPEQYNKLREIVNRRMRRGGGPGPRSW
jgi:Spy/CpxP family protein refolding chaperone